MNPEYKIINKIPFKFVVLAFNKSGYKHSPLLCPIDQIEAILRVHGLLSKDEHLLKFDHQKEEFIIVIWNQKKEIIRDKIRHWILKRL